MLRVMLSFIININKMVLAMLLLQCPFGLIGRLIPAGSVSLTHLNNCLSMKILVIVAVLLVAMVRAGPAAGDFDYLEEI